MRPTVTPAAADPVKIELVASPNPAAMGDVERIITLTDPSGQPIEDAQVDLLASHNSVAGMDMQGQATGQTIRKDFDLSVK